MMASRGMGDIASSKMPKGARKERRDDTDFTEYKKGGLAKQAATAIAMKAKGIKPKKMAAGGDLKEVDSVENPGLAKLPTEVRNKMGYMKEGGGVNAAGNYTKPSLRKSIVARVKAAATQGTRAGQWSARKAQLVAKRYKAAGGGYRD